MRNPNTEYQFFDGTKTQVVIGQTCCIGDRIKYNAIDEAANKFVELYPNDIGIFLGHVKTQRMGYYNKNFEYQDFFIEEVAVFPRTGIVVCCQGVLEPIKSIDNPQK